MTDDFFINYKIGDDDRIVFVNDDWSRFALENDAPELVRENVLGRTLWDFIGCDTTLELYKKLVAKARSGASVSFEFRCDAPDARRLLKMNVKALEKNEVLFETRPLLVEERARQNVFLKSFPRSKDCLIVCSWCNKIETSNENWQEVESAVSHLELFRANTLPHLSHGICLPCYEKVFEKIQKSPS